jgi:hypothetical protein
MSPSDDKFEGGGEEKLEMSSGAELEPDDIPF